MIIAAGLSPAWQRILVLDSFAVGAVNRAVEVHECASGKVLNVGRALHALSAECKTISPVGGIPGRAIRQEFERDGIDAVWIDAPAPTRVCTTVLDASSGETTELVEESAPLGEDAMTRFQEELQSQVSAASCAILTGSLPAGVPADCYLQAIAGTSAKLILDLRGAELLEMLRLRPFVVKPNRDELAHTVRRDLDSNAALESAMRELNAAGAEWVVVTDGPGVVRASHANELLHVRPPEVATVNPIGCGDCLAAGLAVAQGDGLSFADALRFAVAAAALNATELLPARLERAAVQELASRIQVSSGG